MLCRSRISLSNLALLGQVISFRSWFLIDFCSYHLPSASSCCYLSYVGPMVKKVVLLRNKDLNHALIWAVSIKALRRIHSKDNEVWKHMGLWEFLGNPSWHPSSSEWLKYREEKGKSYDLSFFFFNVKNTKWWYTNQTCHAMFGGVLIYYLIY